MEQQYQVSQEQAMDVLMNGFFNHEATPSILGLQVPNFVSPNSHLANSSHTPGLQSRYNVLLGIIEELKKDVRPSYACSKTSAERLKRNINLARVEIRNCLMEMERCNEDMNERFQDKSTHEGANDFGTADNGLPWCAGPCKLQNKTSGCDLHGHSKLENFWIQGEIGGMHNINKPIRQLTFLRAQECAY